MFCPKPSFDAYVELSWMFMYSLGGISNGSIRHLNKIIFGKQKIKQSSVNACNLCIFILIVSCHMFTGLSVCCTLITLVCV